MIGLRRIARIVDLFIFGLVLLFPIGEGFNAALANILTDYDIVLVQELVALLDDGTYPDSDTCTEDIEADALFDEVIR